MANIVEYCHSHNVQLSCMCYEGRKRQGEFPGSEGGGFGVPGDDGFRKKPRFDGPPGPGESDEVPPSTLRVLIRNTDAGGIIGKVSGDVLIDAH